MSNPYLPKWEYIPDGEPRAFGDRVYIYGSHDKPGAEQFCDHKLKVWSASADDLSRWVCHGDAFHTRADCCHSADTTWTDRELYAPDVVECGGKYYLYAYIVGSKGCVGVADRPEGPFKLHGQYEIPDTPQETLPTDLTEGIFIDPGVLVDDDGRVYMYCGYLYSWMCELNPKNVREVIPGTYKRDIIPTDEPFSFFEACSPRKVGDTYYMIYSPKHASRLVYATSKSPAGPFEYRGVIIDSGKDYPGGNNHGSICKIKDKWYVFYHRMTNNTIMSRRACVEPIVIAADGSIAEVEATSQGFAASLSPYEITSADLACILTGGCYITEKNIFERPIINITGGCVVGYKYFDFGCDYSNTGMTVFIKTNGTGQKGRLAVRLDQKDAPAIGEGDIPPGDGIMKINLPNITGRHAVYFTFETGREGWYKEHFDGRELCQMVSFVFTK